MSLTNPNTPVSQQDLQDFYHKLVPYLGGSSGGSGGGHTIEDSEGTDLTQRDILQFGEGFKAEDDDTNEKTVISPDVMQSGDMSDVITPLPSVAPKKEGIKYSTTEQVIGEWIDGRPVYQKTVEITNIPNNNMTQTPHNISDLDTVIKFEGMIHVLSTISALTWTPLPRIQDNSTTVNIGVDILKTSIQLKARSFDATKTFDLAYVTLQYTKTTDTPNT